MIRRSATVLLPLLTVLLLMGAGFGVQSRITTSAFDRLEADQVEQDAQRVRIGLDAWVALLRNYGATNSIWDSSYADVAGGDPGAFASDFPATDVKTIYGLDGVLGVAPDGRLRVGGLVRGEGYVVPPGRLATRATLAGLFDPAADAGDSRCGVVDSGSGAYLYCGFAAHRSDGTADGAGGLVFLRSLGGAGLADLGRQLSMPLSSPAAPGRDGWDLTGWSRMPSSLGRLATATTTVGGSWIALRVALPVGNGTLVVLPALRPRPIHGEAVRVSR